MVRFFFHSDIDGIASTAIYANLSDSLKTAEYSLHPVPSGLRGNCFNLYVNKFPHDSIIIFDFQYHPRAVLWIDHHYSDEMGDDPIFNQSIVYDYKMKSAAHLVLNYFEQFGSVPEYAKLLAESADMVDSALYPDIEYIFKSRDPIMKLHAYLSTTFPSDMIFSRIVEILDKCNLNLDKSLHIMNIDNTCIDNVYQNAMKIKDRIQIYGNFSVVFVKYFYQFPRYSENLVAPHIKYNLRVCDETKNEFKITMSYNKWCGSQNLINIGRFLATTRFSKRGGGHYNVGGVFINKKDLQEFLNYVSMVINEGDVMEKYGVDKQNDPVEKKAGHLVKTGQAKDIKEARERICNESESEDKSQS